MKNPRIVFFGTSHFVTPILSKLESTGWIYGVVTTPAKPTGRDKKITKSPIEIAASPIIYPNINFTGQNLEEITDYHQNTILTPEEFNPEVIQTIKDLKPDLFIVASYGKILPNEVLDMPTLGAINIHPSALPFYRGASPIPAALLNGDTDSAVSFILMDHKMDHGPLLKSIPYPISLTDTFESLAYGMFQKAADEIDQVINEYLDQKLIPIAQDDTKATYTWKTHETKQKAFFDINNPPSVEVLDRMIRAFYPWPTAWTNWKGKVVKFYPHQLVQIEGKKPISLEEFLRGYPDFPIKQLKPA